MVNSNAMLLDAGLVRQLQELPARLRPFREEILAALVTIGQLPGAGGHERQRVRYLIDRFADGGLPDAGADEFGNAVGFLPGRRGGSCILCVAHLDSVIRDDEGCSDLRVEADRVVGDGVGDNALGDAVLAMLPSLLGRLGIELDCDVQLLGSVRSIDRGDLAGLRFFLDNARRNYRYGLCLEGQQLGRLNYFSIGTVRGDVRCQVRPHDSRSFGATSAIVVMNSILNRLLSIEVPARPFTRIRLARVKSGTRGVYDVEPESAILGFEIVSHSDAVIERIISQIRDIVVEADARSTVDVSLDLFSRRQAGGIPFSHRLVKVALGVMEALDVPPDQGHSPSELSEFLGRGLPAITLGITRGAKNLDAPDFVQIDPILTGVAQVIGLLVALDAGACDDATHNV
jgi:tripeptide aminopeptidase